MTTIHQFLPILEPGAVGAHTLVIRRLLRRHGVDSEIFAEHVHPACRDSGRHFRDYGSRYPADRDDLLVYQMASDSDLAGYLAGLPQRLVVNHHNITPARYFSAWDPSASVHLRQARSQLRMLAGRAAIGIAPSEFNERELRGLGFRETAVVPILLDTSEFHGAGDPAHTTRLLKRKSRGGTDVLFVGRISPNKCQHDLVRALAAQVARFDDDVRLHLVGGPSPASYFDAVSALARALGLGDRVELTGPVPHETLVSHYETADVFVCLSEHEGFCVPLLEAWHHKVPVVAFAASAVPETLGDAGLLIPTKRPDVVAAAVHRVGTDQGLAGALTAAGTRRLTDFGLETTSARMLSTLLDAA